MTEGPVTVLLIEDNPGDARLVREMLTGVSAHQFKLECSDRLSAGLDRLSEGGVDAVLLDLNLPDSKGLDTFARVHAEAPAIPIVVLTGLADEMLAIEAARRGAQEYLVKDQLDARLLAHAVRYAIERKRVEEDRRHSELQYRRVVDNISDALVVDDLEGRVLFANPSFIELFGITRDDLRSLVLEDFIAPEWRAEVRDCHQRRVRGEDVPQRFEYEGVRRDGIRLWLEAAVVPVVEEGRIVGTQSTIRDVSERKQAKAALRQSEADLRGLVENATYGIFRATPEGQFLWANPALVEMLGYGSEEEVRRLDLGRDVYADPLDRQRLMEQWKGADQAEGAEVEWKRKDGRLIRVRLSGRSVHNEVGELVCFEDIVEDVTEQRSVEAQLRGVQKMEAIGRLAGGLAHDFNNILTVILGNSEFLLSVLEAGDPRREELEEIQEAGQSAASLTRQLLAFSRSQVLEPKLLDLNAAVADLEKMLRRLIGEDIKLVKVLDPALGAVEADPGQIEQVIMNLVVNARDAMPEGGKLVIETANVDLDGGYSREHTSVTPGRYVMLAVSDTGSGMDEEIRSRIFEPFFTTKEVGSGTGLGLSTVYGIVKQSGGNIWTYSEPGQGTTFKVYLPRVDRDVESGETETSRSTQLLGSETVLLVEDDEGVRSTALRALRRTGYTVLEACDGEEALQTCRRHEGPIHLMITDLVMPGMSGLELAKHVAPLCPGMPVLYMSGYTDHAVLSRFVFEPGTHYLQKPFTPDTLASKTREVLDAAQAQSQHRSSGR